MFLTTKVSISFVSTKVAVFLILFFDGFSCAGFVLIPDEITSICLICFLCEQKKCIFAADLDIHACEKDCLGL